MNLIKNKLMSQYHQLLGGSITIESLLTRSLSKYYQSKFYKDWALNNHLPHHEYQRIFYFLSGFDTLTHGMYYFWRAFYSTEIISEGDVVLDIGCGDGFFTKRFYSQKSAHIDAIDIENETIITAKRINNDPKINYITANALTVKFPNYPYDVIIWDGAIGHFPRSTIKSMLKKLTLI